jgi:hypothetical protein
MSVEVGTIAIEHEHHQQLRVESGGGNILLHKELVSLVNGLLQVHTSIQRSAASIQPANGAGNFLSAIRTWIRELNGYQFTVIIRFPQRARLKEFEMIKDL